MSLEHDLQSHIHGEIETDATALTRASRDASIFSLRPTAVVHPMNTEDVKEIVSYATSHPGTSLTVRSGGTDMSGGALGEGIIVDVGSHLTRVGDIHGSSITVDAGAPYREMEKQTLGHGLLMPSYPASKNICTVGGIVNNNAGGEKNLLYGKTDKYVASLRVVLSDANEYELRPLSPRELTAAMREKTFLGEVYTRMYSMLEHNYHALQRARPKVAKNSAGYALWDVWDKKRFDFTKLFCGSQGTLGITTSITFRLIRPQGNAHLLVASLTSLNDIGTIINDVKKYHPESIESYDDHTLSLATPFLQRIWKSAAGLFPKLTLLIECTGSDAKEVRARTLAIQSILERYGATCRIVTDPAKRQAHWHIRRESFNLLKSHTRAKKAAPFIEDFIIEPQYLPEFLPKLANILGKYNMDYTIAGHAGDGNFHIMPLVNLTDRRERDAIVRMMDEVYPLVFSYHGSSTAEHNDGLLRSHLLSQMFGEHVYSLFEETKRIFDPNNIFNPGKKVNTNWPWAQQHIK